MTTTTVYVTIGNSDDKLEQHEWSDFWHEVSALIQNRDDLTVFGEWLSAPNSMYQNACWGFSANDDNPYWRREMKEALSLIANRHRQDSIAWVEGHTTMIDGAQPFKPSMSDRLDWGMKS